MADNIAITAGTGTTIATDEVGSAHYQYVKTAFGADGTATLTSSTNPFPVGGSGAAALGKAEDAAHTTGDVGVPILAVVTTDNDGTSVTDGDYAFATMNIVGAVRVQDVPNTTGGLSIFRSIDLDETEEDIKATAGMLYALTITNNTAATKEFVKLYDAAAATVVVGTDTPVMTIPVEGATTLHLEWPKGLAFATAICAAATTGIADNDTGAPAANAIVINAAYK